MAIGEEAWYGGIACCERNTGPLEESKLLLRATSFSQTFVSCGCPPSLTGNELEYSERPCMHQNQHGQGS